MKQILAVIFLHCIVTSNCFGQSADTIGPPVMIRIDCSPKFLDTDRQPLVIVTYGEEKVLLHKEMEYALKQIKPEKISGIDILKPKEAEAVYGNAARNGAVLISLDENLVKRRQWNRFRKSQP